jgi:hypothetical protein
MPVWGIFPETSFISKKLYSKLTNLYPELFGEYSRLISSTGYSIVVCLFIDLTILIS